jgi:Protein of unknown function (DUF3800)
LGDDEGLGGAQVIKIFVDESGTHNDADVVTVAAYAGRPKAWREWSAEWRKAKKPIKVFHAVDAANRKGEFKGWSQEKRTELVKKLVPVIMGNRIAGLVIALNKAEFRKATEGKEELLKALGSPYTTCFHWLVQSVLELLKPGKKETLKFVHEKNSYEKEAKASFEFIAKDANPNKVPMRLLFGGKHEQMPLQTADILAYEAYKKFKAPNEPERKPWQILRPKIVVVHFGKDNMEQLVQSLEEIVKNIGESDQSVQKSIAP